MSNNNKALIGIAGAHFVAAELSQQGYVATVTSRNTEGIDVLASSQDGLKVVSIQVKTSGAKQRKSFSRSWIMNKKHENIYSDNLYYIFVDLKPTSEKPDFYIVPSKTVAEYVKNAHAAWLKTLSKGGKQHKDSDMRLFEIKKTVDVSQYLNRWDRLNLDEKERA